jgi:uncharacterized protein
MVVRALDLVPQCYSADDGTVVALAVLRCFETENKAEISFDGVSDVPSSFVNAAFVSLLDEYPIEYIREKLVIMDATKQIADMVRRCLANGIRIRQERTAQFLAHRFVITKDRRGEYHVHFKYNSETIFMSEGYSSKSSALAAIDAFKKNGPGAYVEDAA